MTKIAVLLVALAAVGCDGSVDHIDYWVDSTVPAQAAADACKAWRDGVGVECTRVLPEYANVLITAFRGPPTVGAQTAVWKQPISVKINLNGTQNMATAIAHEFGHALGLGHLDSAPAIMNTGNFTFWYDQPILTDVDIAGWRALYPQ